MRFLPLFSCLPFICTSAISQVNFTPDALRSYGSGFFISEQGHVVTCWHVVKDAKRIEIQTNDGLRFIVTNRFHFDVDDVAILAPVSLLTNKTRPLPVLESADKVELGEEIWTVGYPNPQIQGYAPKVSQGIVNSLTGLEDKQRWLQISIPLQPGNSGGAIVDSKANVIGMVQAQLDELEVAKATGAIPQNVNYAIKAQSVWVASQIAGVKIKSRNRLARNQSDRIKDLLDSSVLIRVN